MKSQVLLVFYGGYDIIAAGENQAPLKGAFDFPAALTSKRPMKSDKEH
ncbi:MAG: hypothetical protein NC091_09555 [Bacteroides sp.]|nr:hypothetical protein [Bacteroides sp.]